MVAPSKKIRVDQLLVKKGLVVSRHQAQSLIMLGKVSSPKGVVMKAGQLVHEHEELTISEALKYVSRGGLKLEHALDEFEIDPSGLVCLDVGASTGGFTDCLLQRGAKKVYAVDVGYGQFDWKLRNDPRIVLVERSNFRYIDADKIPEPVGLVAVDVSFISLTKILPKISKFLIKGKGVVRSKTLREKAVQKIEKSAQEFGYKVLGRTTSPILGAKGNEEFFLLLSLK
ncbi:MAG: TlyA family RNA methyltransferase [Deltaproteobacteria bacterium]|nr:TlyA family RNA methyltransferase [Deltaproteobacteria bacterium]